MALLTLANLISEVTDEIPNKEQAFIVRAINKVLRRIYTENVEPQRGTFTTVPSVTTGTVSVTQDSTSVVFSSGIVLAADPLRIVQIDGEQSWFNLTRGAGDTLGALSSKWPTTTNATATFTIAYPTITFPAAVGEILSIWREGFEPLHFNSDAQLSTILPQVTSGIPTHWSPYLHDEAAATPSDDLRRVFLAPVVMTRMVYSYTYKPRFTFLDPAGLTTQTLPLGDLWYEAIIAGTLFWLWKQEDQGQRALIQSTIFEEALARARGSNLPSATIRPRRIRSGIMAYEDRPIG